MKVARGRTTTTKWNKETTKIYQCFQHILQVNHPTKLPKNPLHHVENEDPYACFRKHGLKKNQGSENKSLLRGEHNFSPLRTRWCYLYPFTTCEILAKCPLNAKPVIGLHCAIDSMRSILSVIKSN